MTKTFPKHVAFFDVDHTLIDGNSGFFTSVALVRHGILKKRRILQAVYYYLMQFLVHQDVKKIYQIAIQDMAGTPIDHILKIGGQVFEKSIRHRFFSEGMAKIAEHRAGGDEIVLLTSGPYMTIYHVEQFLKADCSYTMGPEIIDNILTPVLRTPICHAEGKLHFAKEHAKKRGLPLEQCYFYTDHVSDLPLLKKVGYPRVVNPGRRLRAMAMVRGWPILKFTNHLV